MNCENCKFYVQHYGFDSRIGIYKIEYGHCTKRQTLMPNCKNYIAETDLTKRIKNCNALTELTKIKIMLNEIKKAIAHILPNLK